ncbi:hypothetical protein LSAT2_032064 [Lamellibrachia satsuma]|nr:hypothetical protein LSAT2_032064 [Lamellibrachia satsuma]
MNNQQQKASLPQVVNPTLSHGFLETPGSEQLGNKWSHTWPNLWIHQWLTIRDAKWPPLYDSASR